LAKITNDVSFSEIEFPEFALDSAETPKCSETDPELFHPIETNIMSANGTYKTTYIARDERLAKSICAGCPLKNPCLEFALRNSEVGIWGGTTETDRQRIKSRFRSNRRNS